MDCGVNYYYDECNNVFDKESKKYVGKQVHDDDCPCDGNNCNDDSEDNEDECWYYVKYLNEF